MVGTAEEFTRAFYSLTEVSIGKRRKQLYHLLNQINLQKIDFNSIEARTPLEEKFIIDSLIFFKKWPELVDKLSCENPAITKKILNTKGCLQLISSFSNEEFLQLLSNVSYNIKLKILNKLPLYIESSKADGIFDAVLDRYNFYLASKVLPGCSTHYLLKFLKDVRWKPTTTQLMQIAKRHPDLHADLLTLLTDEKTRNCRKTLFKHIAKNNSKLFLKFYEDKQLENYYGRRATRKFIKFNTANVTENPNLYYKFLHKKQMMKSLGENLSLVYFNMFPPDVGAFQLRYHTIIESLENLPVSKRNANVLSEVFLRKYGKSFWDCSEYVSLKILELLPNEQRLDILKPEFKGYTDEDRWMCYYDTAKAIAFLKKRMFNSSDIKTRVILTELLVVTCKINKDKDTLTQMCHYMNTQHRNDHSTVRSCFLKAVQRHFGLDALEERHWTPILELIALFKLNDEHFYQNDEFMEEYIRFRLKKNLPIQEQLLQYVKTRTCNFNILKDAPSYEKQCLEGFGVIVPDAYNETDAQMFSVMFLRALASWNRRHPKERLSLLKYSKVMSHFTKSLEEDNMHSLKGVIKMGLTTESAEDLVSLYLAPHSQYNPFVVVLFTLRMEPELIYSNMNDVLKLLVEDSRFKYMFWNICHYYHHLGIPQKMAEICLQLDNVEEQHLECLSFLMPPNDFFQFIKKRIGDGSKDQLTKTANNKKLGDVLRNIKITPSIFEVMLTLCGSDFFFKCFNSLYSIAYNLNEQKLLTLLSGLSKLSFFCRKHSLHLAFQGLPEQQISTFLNSFGDEKNSSVRKSIFRSFFKLFAQNPSTESFELFKSIANATEVFDNHTLGIIIQTPKISSSFLISYTLLIWDLLLHKVSKEQKEKYLGKFLKSISLEQMQLLPLDFCVAVTEYLFKSDLNPLQVSVQVFICKVLISTTADSVLQVVSDKLKQYVSDGSLEKHRFRLTHFVQKYCLLFLDSTCSDKNVFTKFLNVWNEVLQPHDAFNEYLHLQFTLIYVDRLGSNELASRLMDLCRMLSDSYGSSFIKPFCQELKFFMSYFFKNDEFLEEKVYVILENLIESKRRIATFLLLAILLFNEYPPTFDVSKKKYRLFLSVLQEQPDPLIQIYLHSHLKTAHVS